MGYYAVVVPAYTGHLNPMIVLARELQRRGHRIAVLSSCDAGAKVQSAGLEFIAIAGREFPDGEWQRLAARAGAAIGFRATWIAGKMLAQFARGIFRDLPLVAAREKFDGVIMDQIAIGTEGVCQATGLPLAVACNALTFHIESAVPPTAFAWRRRTALPFRLRNIAGQMLVNMCGLNLLREDMPYRLRHRLPQMTFFHINELRPSLVQVAQQPAFFDFRRDHLPDHFHYTGPWIEDGAMECEGFPWEKLDGRPLIYASLGSLQNRLDHVFRTIAEACAGLDAQLVLALGRRGASLDGEVVGNPIVVDYAPQLALLRRATLAITHGGLNTTLESLREGVPLVALPITNDQPGVGARIRALGVGEFIRIRKLNAGKLRAAIARVLATSKYRERARSVAEKIRGGRDHRVAAELIERALTTRQRVRRRSDETEWSRAGAA
jgi:MGT family glycosyltransferase